MSRFYYEKQARQRLFEELPEVDLSKDPDDNPLLAMALSVKWIISSAVTSATCLP